MTMESLDRAGKHPQNQVPEKQKAINLARQVLTDFNVVDPGPKVESSLVATPVESTQPKPDLLKQTYELLLRTREPRPEERKALEERGFAFFDIKAKSLAQLIQENPKHFGYVHESGKLREYVPTAMAIALNLKQLALPNSNSQTLAVQLEMIEESSKPFEQKFPDAKMVMLPASAYTQADIRQKIFKNFFARTLDETVGSRVAGVGRNRPGFQLYVLDWRADDGLDVVVAVPAVVFLKK